MGIIALIIVFALIGLALGWFKGETKIRSFENADAQATAVRDDWNGMIAIVGTACGVTVKDGAQQFVEDPKTAYRGLYNSKKADFDRRMSNHFEAEQIRGLAHIKDLPDVAPTFDEASQEACPTTP